jgi:hypothetical protein
MAHVDASAILIPHLSGPVDAAYKAVDNLVRVEAELVDYGVNRCDAAWHGAAHSTCVALM